MTLLKAIEGEGAAAASLQVNENKRQKNSIQSVERAFAILEHIARSPAGAALSELSKQLMLHPTTVFHLVHTMVALGYVRQGPDSKRFRIGRPLFALAAADQSAELISIATPVLKALSAKTGEAGQFAVWSGHKVLILANSPGAGSFQMVSTVGGLRPAYATALGKALLAAFDDADLERYFKETSMSPLTPRTHTDQKLLRRELEEVRKSDVAFADGELDSEISCVASVVRDSQRRVVGAIGISGPVWRLASPLLQEASSCVHSAAAEMSAALDRQMDRAP